MIGCALIILLGGPIVMFAIMTYMIGRCDSDGACLPLATYYAIFPGLILFVLIASLFVTRWAMKDDF